MTQEQVHVAMAQVNLLFQIIILAIIVVGIVLKRRGSIVWHGNAMLLAVLLNLTSFLMMMGPSFLKFSVGYLNNAYDITSIVGILHGSLGAVATVLGLWVAISWGFFNPSTSLCSRRRKIMLAITIVWVISLASGIVVFTFHTVLYPT